MNIDYRITAVVATVVLCFSTLFTKLAMKYGLTPKQTLIVFAAFVLVFTCAHDLYEGEKFWEMLNFPKGLIFACAGGILAAVSLSLYYKSMGLGPISTVTPIWSLQAVGVGILGVIFLSESLTGPKAAAVVLAVLAVWLITRPV